MVLAFEVQLRSSVVETKSVGLYSGFLAVLAAFTLSSYFWDTVARMVLAAGASIPGCGGRLFPLFMFSPLREWNELDEVVDEDEVVVAFELELVIESVSESELESNLSVLMLVCVGLVDE